ncbi:hypothetical protein BCIN_01g03280 [Botrytis cinerea B05.10]|uniref:UBC core domain-containing protein n=1 Tax=Botryotinia fuckeliana (strain B05.10) TaxID=332648 RepID=A0A384J4W1_BOTFB|nr:hypothetical protein BCIN_01g03280 [Botrytis cinerea B05.10]ATZ45566.1 hypothetical protein BCIN_01g03280 [Botrytis cinerea B05.10]
MAEDPEGLDTWVDVREELGLNQPSMSMSTSNPNPGTKTTPSCGEKLSKIRNMHKVLVHRAIRAYFGEMPLSVLKVSREKEPYDRTRNLCLEYEAVHADSTTPYLSVCPASLYSAKVGGLGSAVDLTNAIACIEGPSESPYAGGIFFLHIYFPIQYPESPMKVRFLTQIHHPNISTDEDLYLPSIAVEWPLKKSLHEVLSSIFSILSKPELDDHFIPEIAKEYIDDYKGFFEKATISTSKHASKERLDVGKLVLDWIQDYVSLDYEIASCHKALLLWRQNIWEALPKDGSVEDVELQCVIPDSAIVTISKNLRRLCTGEVGLEGIDLSGWDKCDQYIRDHSKSSLGNTLVLVWLMLQKEKRGIIDNDYMLPGWAPNITVETCQLFLRQWRDEVWGAYPEDTFNDLQSVIPDSAIVTISNNLEKLGYGHIKLEHLDLREWDYSTEFIDEGNEFGLRNLLQNIWEEFGEAKEKTKNIAVPGRSHDSSAKGPKPPRGLQLLGFKIASYKFNQKSFSSRSRLLSHRARILKSKQEPRITKSDQNSKAKNSKSKQRLQTKTSASGAKADSSSSGQGSGVAKGGLGSEIGSSNSNKRPQITRNNLVTNIQGLAFEVEELDFPISKDDLRPMAEDLSFNIEELDLPNSRDELRSMAGGLKTSQELQATGGEETSKGLKGGSKGKGPGTS